jgi:hypothetical protein
MTERTFLRDDLIRLVQTNAGVAEFGEAVERHHPDVSAFRENEDLILVQGEGRRLLVRRSGPDRFRTVEIAAASGSTNLLDAGEGAERDLDGLIDEIVAFAAL